MAESGPTQPPKRWPVSDREVKPWWFHALNYGSAAFLAFCFMLLVLAALLGWANWLT